MYSLRGKHKSERLKYCTQWITNNVDWNSVVFSDEKRFSIDGPDCWMSYMSNHSSSTRNKKQCKGGGLMYWGMVLPCCAIHLIKLIGKQNSDKYEDIVMNFAVPIIKSKLGKIFLLQQDNCSIHVSKKMKIFIWK